MLNIGILNHIVSPIKCIQTPIVQKQWVQKNWAGASTCCVLKILRYLRTMQKNLWIVKKDPSSYNMMVKHLLVLPCTKISEKRTWIFRTCGTNVMQMGTKSHKLIYFRGSSRIRWIKSIVKFMFPLPKIVVNYIMIMDSLIWPHMRSTVKKFRSWRSIQMVLTSTSDRKIS